jgi:hypothetical protein
MNERQYTRIWLNLPVEYSFGISRSCGTGFVSNLGPGGVRLSSHDKLNLHQHVDLEIFVSLGTNMEAIKFHTKVVWADGAAQKGMFLSGTKFIDPSDADRDKLARVIDEFSAGNPPAALSARGRVNESRNRY